VTLANDRLSVEVIPELGGRIWSLRDHRGIEWIWHNPHVPLKKNDAGSDYDDNWAGGWEELFPNDASGEFQGRQLLDHGEWWSAAWQWETVSDTPDAVSIRLSRRGNVTPATWEKIVSLARDENRVTVRYRVTNTGPDALHVLFKQHLPVAVTAYHRIELPGGRVTPVDLSFSRRLGEAAPFTWPVGRSAAGQSVDLSVLPPAEEKLQEFVYVADLPEGWCGVTDSRTGAGIRLHYPQATFPFVWLFMSFGGWRDVYTVVLEPCTNMPKDLEAARHAGQCAVIAPAAAFETWTVAEIL